MKELLEKALELVKPSQEEEQKISARITAFLAKLNKGLRGVKAELGGSGAKGTWVKGIRDADIYMKFPFSRFKSRSQELSELVEPILKKKFKGARRLHGSRDYFQIKDQGFIFEIIPILDITHPGQAKNITDISPMHTRWVRKHKQYRDEILLTKGFCKAAEVYGAESYIKGLSGYAIEILTIHYKGFLKLIRAASRWGEKELIDPAKHHKHILLEVNKSKLISPLVLIDPVQAGRNAAAALSEEKYLCFIKACKDFLRKPSTDFFTAKSFDLAEIKKIKNVIIAEAAALEGKADIAGTKLLKAFEYLTEQLREFGVRKKGWHWDDTAYFWFVLGKTDLEPYEIREGPPTRLSTHAEIFRKKYRKVFEKRGRLYAKIPRTERNPASVLKKAFKDPYVKERVKRIRCLKSC